MLTLGEIVAILRVSIVLQKFTIIFTPVSWLWQGTLNKTMKL